MNGRDLTLGALAGLAVAGLVKQRSGSRSLPAVERTRILREVTSKIQDEMQRVGWWGWVNGEHVYRHDRPTAWDINNGMCEEWAETAARRIGGDAIELSSLQYKKFGLPKGIFEDVAHMALLLDGRFYDAQDIEGVDDPRQLQLVRGVSRQQFVRGSMVAQRRGSRTAKTPALPLTLQIVHNRPVDGADARDAIPDASDLIWQVEHKPGFRGGAATAEATLIQKSRPLRWGRVVAWASGEVSETNCKDLLESLRERGFLGRPWSVMQSYLDPRLQGRGYGTEGYLAVIAGIQAESSSSTVFFASDGCGGAGTSDAALRVWTSLAQEFPHVFGDRKDRIVLAARFSHPLLKSRIEELLLSRQPWRRGSRARDPYAPLRALGYTDSEITRALAAAGQGPTALERGDKTTQTAGPTQEGAYPGLDFRPPPEVRKEALRGLQLRKANEQRGVKVDPKTGAGPGGWWIGVGRAIQLATLPAMPPREITRMRDYFRRHAVDMKSAGAVRGQATPGVVAWLLWGGDASRDWSRDLAGQMDRMDAEREGGRKGARFARGETGPRTKHPRTGSRALTARGARLTAELAGRPRRRRGSKNASDPTAGLSDPLQALYDTLDLSDDQKAKELACEGPSWLLWSGLSEGGHDELAEAYEQSDYDTEAILPRIKDELGAGWLREWYYAYVPQLLQQDAADAPSFLYFDRPKVLRNVWLVHFTDDADAIEREGFRHGIDDPMRVGLTTYFTKAAKAQPGYTFAFRPEDVNRYAWSRGSPKYGKEAVVFRADAVLAYHTSDEEDQAIAWGPEAKDRRAVRMEGRSPVITNADGEEVEYDSFPSLVAAIQAGA